MKLLNFILLVLIFMIFLSVGCLEEGGREDTEPISTTTTVPIVFESTKSSQQIVRSQTPVGVTSETTIITSTTTTTSLLDNNEEGYGKDKELKTTKKTCTKNFDCELGEKCVTVYFYEGEIKFPRSQCFKEEVSCFKNEDCTLGLKCFPFCYNGVYEGWHNENVVSCIWNSNGDSYKKVECECINNLCEIMPTKRCKSDEDCNIGLRCYPGGYCQ